MSGYSHRWDSSAVFPLFAFSLLVFLRYAIATQQHIVGGSAGWTIPGLKNVNYTIWADNNYFHVGDTLLFVYNKAFHTVDQVSKADYESCSDSKRLAHYDDGNTVIRLNKAGSFYFICGVIGHCSAGQKVEIVVNAEPEKAFAPSPLLAPVPFSVSSPTGSKAQSPSSPSFSPTASSMPVSPFSVSSSPSPFLTGTSTPSSPPGITSDANIKLMACMIWAMVAACFFWIVM